MSIVNNPNISFNLFIPSNTKLSRRYTFNSEKGILTIHDSDYIRLLAATNITRGVLLFAPTHPGFGVLNGSRENQLLVDTSNMSDGDEIFVLYEYAVKEQAEILENILEEMREHTKYLRKILK